VLLCIIVGVVHGMIANKRDKVNQQRDNVSYGYYHHQNETLFDLFTKGE
jgi:hypothetical protein